jgi:hypothetical protein
MLSGKFQALYSLHPLPLPIGERGRVRGSLELGVYLGFGNCNLEFAKVLEY